MKIAFTAILLLVSGLAGFSQTQPEAGTSNSSPQVSSNLSSRPVAKTGQPLSLQDIKELAKKDLNSEIILKLLQNNPGIYVLTTQDVNDLQGSGVKPDVIDYLLSTPRIYQTQPTSVATTQPVEQTPSVTATATAPVATPPPTRVQTRTVYVPTYVQPTYVQPRTTWHVDVPLWHGFDFGHHSGGHHGGSHHGGGHHSGGHH